MDTFDHNHAKQIGPETPERLNTLGDLRNWIAGVPELPDGEKAQLRSAIKRADELIGHGALDLAADPQKILSKLDQLSPVMTGMSRQGFANLKSRVRKAFQLATPVLKSARSYVRLTGEWRALQQRLGHKDRFRLSRFLRFAWGQGWEPQAIIALPVPTGALIWPGRRLPSSCC
jgi:hypothetical protein